MKIESDGEFKKILETIDKDLGARITFLPAGAHKSYTERNNHKIGEHIHTMYHNIPFKAISKIMLTYSH